MARRRSVFTGGAAIAAAVMLAAAPAVAARPAAVQHPAPAKPAPASGGTVPTPAAAMTNDQLYSDSCTIPKTGTSARYTCEAAGTFVTGGTVHPLTLTWSQGGTWTMLNGGTVTASVVDLPNELSCAAGNPGIRCLLVGQHYTNPSASAALAEAWSGSSWANASPATPAGSTWSSLQDVSCPAANFCVMVGTAGTTRGAAFTGHATAYSWNGSGTTRLSPPVPAGAKTSELAGVACASAADCTAVGNYTSARGAWLPYSVRWHAGTWKLRSAPAVAGQASTTFNAVACPSAALCLAVGVSAGPGGHPFGAKFSAGAWHLMTMPAASQAGLAGISCPGANRCLAAGWRGNAGLIETWNGGGWTIQASPATPAPLTGTALLHVSCVTATECVAVGFRFNPKIAAATRAFSTLAEIWNGTAWKLQATPDK